ncbi:MAG: nucleotidyltransferase substrate binding protein [Proteobacteria bacterium]|nr:nucleotidyltransferase substrate binding protein [Pseudomonadota bacterium]
MSQEIKEAFKKTGKALDALEVMINEPMYENRGNVDASIQRFEFVIELFWKLLRRVLESRGQKAVYPKDVLQEAYAGHLIDDEALWLQMLKDRNQTSHTYDEELADKIYAHIKLYFPHLKKTYLRLYEKYNFTDEQAS